MKNNDKISENEDKIDEKNSEITVENEVNNIDLPQEDKEKIETKGLKLKKSTKERLNLLQTSFEDAESMVIALLNQYEVFKLESNDKFSDRKAEIERFNSFKFSFLFSISFLSKFTLFKIS